MLRVHGLQRLGLGPIDLTVPLGSTTVLMGPSGSGKSLLLRALADLDPCHGEVSLDGVSRTTLSAPAWRRRVVYLATDAGWWDEHVGAHFTDHAAGRDMIAALGLPAEAMDWPVSRASTGERQRLALARTLTLPRDAADVARIFLLDEPTSALDAEAVAQAEAVLRDLPDARTAVFMVSHDAAQAERLADHRLSLRDGHLETAAP